MAQVIRTNKDGIDVNYGELYIGTIDGIEFAIELIDAEIFDLMDLVKHSEGEFPEFVQDMKIMPDHHYKTPYIYGLKREELPALGDALLKLLNRRINLIYMSRVIRVWVPGKPVLIRNIEDFYEGLTEEQIAKSKFGDK